MRVPSKGRVASGLMLVGTGLLVGCSMNGPSNLKIHEVALSGGTNERIVWVYGSLTGGRGSVKLGDTAVDLRPQVEDTLATPGSLSVNGKATYRLATASTDQKISVMRDTAGMFTISPMNGVSVAAVYYTDGQSWSKLTSTFGRTSASPSEGLRGAGQLTDDEGDALGRALRGQGALAVAVLNEPAPTLAVEPTPTESRRTALYVLPGVQTVSASSSTGTTGTVTMTPNASNFTELARGTNATASDFAVMTATTPAQLRNLYAVAYGRQTSQPAAPALGNETVVAIFMGQRSSGGYGVDVNSVNASSGTLTLTVTLKTPGAGLLTTQALTSPWVMVKVPGTYSVVRVVDSSGKTLY